MLQQTEWVAEFERHLTSLCGPDAIEPELLRQIAVEQCGIHQDWPPYYSAQIFYSRYRRHKSPLIYNSKAALP